jgi:hypothetical protein
MTDFNDLVEAEIERHARQWEKTENRLHDKISQQQDQIQELQVQVATVEGDVPWFIKDFHVLYSAAQRVVEACEGGGQDEGRPYPALEHLKAQLNRMRHAFQGSERRKAAGG